MKRSTKSNARPALVADRVMHVGEPVALVVALIWWIAATLKRRRRFKAKGAPKELEVFSVEPA